MTSSEEKPYKLGVALSGGGARGFAHVGALKALEESGLKPDVVAGVSAGSVVAVLYCAGVPLDKMMKLFSDVKFRDLCEFHLRAKGGLFTLEKFEKHILKAIGDYRNIEDLPIPLHIGVTNFDEGIPAVFSTGDIGTAMIASCSIPIVFRPVTINGVRYVDGGVLRNLPAWAIRDKCETLIGINCSPLVNNKFKNTLLDISIRTFNILARSNQREDMAMCDLAIDLPEIANYKVFNLKEIRQLYIRGYTAAKYRIKQWNAALYNNNK